MVAKITSSEFPAVMVTRARVTHPSENQSEFAITSCERLALMNTYYEQILSEAATSCCIGCYQPW